MSQRSRVQTPPWIHLYIYFNYKPFQLSWQSARLLILWSWVRVPRRAHIIFFILGNVPERSKGSDLSSDANMLRGFESHRYHIFIYLFYHMPSQLNWIEHLTSNQKVASSNLVVGILSIQPSGRAQIIRYLKSSVQFRLSTNYYYIFIFIDYLLLVRPDFLFVLLNSISNKKINVSSSPIAQLVRAFGC